MESARSAAGSAASLVWRTLIVTPLRAATSGPAPSAPPASAHPTPPQPPAATTAPLPLAVHLASETPLASSNLAPHPGMPPLRRPKYTQGKAAWCTHCKLRFDSKTKLHKHLEMGCSHAPATPSSPMVPSAPVLGKRKQPPSAPNPSHPISYTDALTAPPSKRRHFLHPGSAGNIQAVEVQGTCFFNTTPPAHDPALERAAAIRHGLLLPHLNSPPHQQPPTLSSSLDMPSIPPSHQHPSSPHLSWHRPPTSSTLDPSAPAWFPPSSS